MAARFAVVDKSRRTMDNIVFDSAKEMRRYAELKMMQRARAIRDLEHHPKFSVSINGRHYCNFTPDFRYHDLDSGLTIIEEVKSTGTVKDPAYNLRRKAAELFHGITVMEIIL